MTDLVIMLLNCHPQCLASGGREVEGITLINYEGKIARQKYQGYVEYQKLSRNKFNNQIIKLILEHALKLLWKGLQIRCWYDVMLLQTIIDRCFGNLDDLALANVNHFHLAVVFVKIFHICTMILYILTTHSIIFLVF